MPSLDARQTVSSGPRARPGAARRPTERASTRGAARTRPAFQAARDAGDASAARPRRVLDAETLAAIALCQGAGLVGVPAVIGAMRSGWYQRLRKPSFQPPAAVFGPTWTVLYVLQGLALRDLWKHVDTPEGAAAVRAFAAQLALNAAWSPAFFGQRSPVGGLAVIGGLLPAVIRTVARARRVSPRAATLLMPYAGWVGFAALLNAGIVALNPAAGRRVPTAAGRSRPRG
jgi:translocator protein